MKFFAFVCVATQLIVANSKILPDLPQPCRKSDSNIKDCFLKAITKVRDSLPVATEQYSIPSGDPLDVPVIFIDRNLNEFVSVNAVLKNARITGLSKFNINDLKIDLENLAGEIDVTHPQLHLSLDYKFAGKFADVTLESQGHGLGDFTDITHNFTVRFKLIEKEGVNYFAVDNFKLKTRIGYGQVQITSKNPQTQPAANYLANIFNTNNRQTLDLVNPIYTDIMEDVLRSVLEQVLLQVPAEKILVE